MVDHNDLEDSFLTVADVAEMLKLNQQTVRNWIDQGSLPALRVGRRVRIRQSDLKRVLADGYNAGTRTPSEGGPSADDFWGGEPVGRADPDPSGDTNGPAQIGDANGPAQIGDANGPAQSGNA
jgi:excisionase family DNA binding protein